MNIDKKFSKEDKEGTIECLDEAIDAFQRFYEFGYNEENNLDESYPDHNKELNFTDQSLDQFISNLTNYRNHLEECLNSNN